MPLEEWTTLRTEHMHRLAAVLSKQKLPPIAQLEPIADFEELYTFTEANPTPVVFSPQNPAWQLEAVAARIVEAVAVAASEPLLDVGYPELARILLEHTEYLYTYPDGDPRPRLEAASALALASCVCAALPHAECWRLAGFGRVAAALAEVAPAPTDLHLTLPLDLAFALADEQNLSILESAVTAYNTVLNRNFTPQTPHKFPLSDREFFDSLNLDFLGMEAVKTALQADDISAAQSAYTTFRSTFLDSEIEAEVVNLLERSDTYPTAKTYLACLLQLSIHPTPAIRATTELGIAAHLFPEFRHSEQVLMLALRRYKWIVDTFFHADGFHKDRTLRSQVDAITNFTRFRHFQSDSQTESLQASLEKQIAACIHLSRPDFSFPSLGALPAPNFDALALCEIVDSSFRREDFPYPDTTAHPLHETGCYVMRSRWEPDAQYLFFDAHPQESANTGDISHLSLYAHRRELTTGSVRVLDTLPLDDDLLRTQWIATQDFNWLERWQVLAPKSGDPQTLDMHHKRTLFYLKGEYCVLHDLVLGAEAGALEQVFRFRRGTPLHVSADAGYAWTQEPDLCNLFISATPATDLTIVLDDDTLIYRCSTESPVVLNTLLLPTRLGIKGHPTISAIPVRTDADVLGTAFTLQYHDTTDTFLISDDGLAEMSAADITFVGEYLCLRRDPSDTDFRFVMLNARFLQVGSRVFVDLAEPRAHYVQM